MNQINDIITFFNDHYGGTSSNYNITINNENGSSIVITNSINSHFNANIANNSNNSNNSNIANTHFNSNSYINDVNRYNGNSNNDTIQTIKEIIHKILLDNNHDLLSGILSNEFYIPFKEPSFLIETLPTKPIPEGYKYTTIDEIKNYYDNLFTCKLKIREINNIILSTTATVNYQKN